MKSVAMAFYNGAKYIDEQIRSILDNMEETDELIISVDDASDGSEAILEDWVQNDKILTDRILCFVIRMMCGKKIK